LILACAADRVELELLCRPGPPFPRLLAKALPEIWPLVSFLVSLRHKKKKKEDGASWWNRLAEPLAAVAGWIDRGTDQDQPRASRRFESE
jgi:hypothetical protein